VTTAQDQTTVKPEKVLHSGNSGMIIHRMGQFKYEFAQEGRGFSVDLLKYVNENQVGVATTFCYEEVFGVRDRIHWFIHLRNPNEYRKLVEMVDHDEKFQDISIVDRLPEKGHGNWEKIFIESSMNERILVPQHGLLQSHDSDDHDDDAEYFASPARNQTIQPFDIQLNSANAGAIILRTMTVKYEFREEGRLFAFDWQEYVNRELKGTATALLYEENFGQQDRIYTLIHLRSLEDYKTLANLDRSPEMNTEIYQKQRVHESKGGGTWEGLFVPASIRDTLLVPQAPSTPAS
jgi:hypothetical protein